MGTQELHPGDPGFVFCANPKVTTILFLIVLSKIYFESVTGQWALYQIFSGFIVW